MFSLFRIAVKLFARLIPAPLVIGESFATTEHYLSRTVIYSRMNNRQSRVANRRLTAPSDEYG